MHALSLFHSSFSQKNAFLSSYSRAHQNAKSPKFGPTLPTKKKGLGFLEHLLEKLEMKDHYRCGKTVVMRTWWTKANGATRFLVYEKFGVRSLSAFFILFKSRFQGNGDFWTQMALGKMQIMQVSTYSFTHHYFQHDGLGSHYIKVIELKGYFETKSNMSGTFKNWMSLQSIIQSKWSCSKSILEWSYL